MISSTVLLPISKSCTLKKNNGITANVKDDLKNCQLFHSLVTSL